MAANTRPYFVVFQGVQHMVEAPNPAAAARHVVGAEITELRPARGAEVSAWLRGGKPIEEIGKKPDATAPLLESDEDPEFTLADGRAWLEEHAIDNEAYVAFNDIYEAGCMGLDDFNRLEKACPAFGEALVAAINDVDDGGDLVTLLDVRTQLEEADFQYAVVIGAIGEAKRRELYEDDPKPVLDPKPVSAADD